MGSMKSQKNMLSEDDPPRSEGPNKLVGKSEGQLLIALERMMWLGQSGSSAQLWICLVVKIKSNAVKNNIA